MKYYKIPEALLTGVIAYLRTRPYTEVEQAIPMLERLEKLVEPKLDGDAGLSAGQQQLRDGKE